jgi:peroxiredoxin
MKKGLSTAARIGLFFGAVIALIAASVLLYTAGLPDRAAYSGQMIEGIGHVAPEIGEFAPPFEQPTLTDDTLNLLDVRGESVIINFWATWCTPCIVEMPALQDLHEATGVRIIGVNMGESHSVVEQWIAENGITYDIALDPQGQVAEAYRLRGQPSTYIIAPDGIITHIFYGAVVMDMLTDALATHNLTGQADDQ